MESRKVFSWLQWHSNLFSQFGGPFLIMWFTQFVVQRWWLWIDKRLIFKCLISIQNIQILRKRSLNGPTADLDNCGFSQHISTWNPPKDPCWDHLPSMKSTAKAPEKMDGKGILYSFPFQAKDLFSGATVDGSEIRLTSWYRETTIIYGGFIHLRWCRISSTNSMLVATLR